MFRLELFGGASIYGPDGPLTGRGVQRRRLALLALLATARGRGISRDKLIGLLWPEADPERSRHLLSDSIYRINQAVAGEAVVAAGEELRLNPDVLPSDVCEFADAIEQERWERAVEVHVAPFLDGFFLSDSVEFEHWADFERARLARERARAFEALALGAEQRGDPAAAVRWWRALAADDPASSRIALCLMRALEDAGERVAAVRHARIHAQLVREHHGVEPDPQVAAYAERLREAPAPPPESPARADAPAPVRKAEAPAPVPEPAPAVSTDAFRRRPGSLVLAAAAAVILLAAFAIRGIMRADGTPTDGVSSIAVLPFRDLSAGADQAYFAHGITEELMVRLAKVDGLRVMGRTSSFAFQGADLREVAARFGVDAILEGSVRRSGERLRIVGQLVDASDGYELWSETYEREVDDVFAIQDEIARAIVTRLRGRLAGADAGRVQTNLPEDAEAYNLYLRGRYEWHRRTEQSLRDAADFFRRAIERAPNYARAHAGLGDALAVLGFYDYLPPGEAFPDARRAAERALELDPGLAPSHATLGYVALYHEWDFIRAEAQFRRTIALDPGYSTGHQWYANLLTALGRFDEARREMQTAMDLDPLSRIANAALGWILFHAGEFDDAARQLGRTLELDAQFELAYLWRGKALSMLGRPDEALPDLRRHVESSDGSPIGIAALGLAFARAGMPDSARAVLRDLDARGGYLPSYEIAKVHEALGDRAEALAWLGRALDQRSHSMVFLAVDPELRTLHDDPAFLRLLRDVGLEPPGG